MNSIVTISPTDIRYPERVRATMRPPALDTSGNLALLSRDAVGICGSRDASPEGLEYAFAWGREAAARGLVVVSGYARGVDRQAHRGALSAGGGTIAVLPEGIEGFRIVKELQPLADLDDNFLAVSMFESGARWQAWRAMERNKLIVALSRELCVVEAGPRGGTINAATECVRQGKPLNTMAPKDGVASEGNEQFPKTVAVPAHRPSDVRDALEKVASGVPARASQIEMALS